MKKISLLVLFVFSLIFNSFAQPSKNLQLLGSLQLTGQTLAGCWHYNDLSGNEYALIGGANGIVIVDITNPATPDSLFQLPGATSLWHEVKVQGDYAYAVSEGFDASGVNNGLQIIDLRFLPDSAPNKFYYGDGIISHQLETAHTVTTAGNYVYVNGHNISSLGRGVLILDITDPLNPVYTGAVTINYCHDSYVRGDTIYTSDIHQGLFSIYDISDRSNPVLLATQATPGAFNHNTWLSDDGKTIFAADEQPNVPLASFDISNFNNIALLDTFYNDNFTNNEVHNVRVFNDFVVAPSYGSQLTLIDASRPMNMIEVGNYTTGSSLCWDADPYGNSGNIIATDMNSGMFYVFSPTYRKACYLEGVVTDSITGLPLNGVAVDIQIAGVSATTGFAGDYRTGYADSGSYTISFSKSGYFLKQIVVSLQNGILTSLDVELLPFGAGISTHTNESILLYPNPVSDFIQICSTENPISEWKLFDISGKIVMKGENQSNTSEKFIIDVSSLASGNYSIELQSKSGKTIKSLVKR